VASGPFSIEALAAYLGCPFRGDSNVTADNLSEIHLANSRSLSFVDNPRYQKYIDSSAAAILIVRPDLKTDFPNLLLSENPQGDFARLIPYFLPERGIQKRMIHPTAIIDETASLGENCHIGPNVAIGHHVKIGNNVTLYPNVTVYDHTEIGDNVIIHSGTVIGSDGFGFNFQKGAFHKIPQHGRVIIEKDVEIGANCTIDRGTVGDTVVGQGSKIDNLVHLAHNVKIGKHCAVAGQTGFAGSAVVEDYCVFGGQVAVNGHISIASGTQVAARTGVTKDIQQGETVGGVPAMPINEFRKREIYLRKLPQLTDEFKKILRFLKEKFPEYL
jgi:UDP-3-O-[3-hydroxymyristoyl] glucosamine N-acyltransferase